jgi:hypothetical protein
MKKYFVIFLLAFCNTLQAQEPKSIPMDLEKAPTSSKPKQPVKSERPNPCAVLERACKAGGYIKYLHRDCLNPILKGHDVPGVSIGDVSLQQIKTCRMFKEDNLKQ